jgi:hypothetical protein
MPGHIELGRRAGCGIAVRDSATGLQAIRPHRRLAYQRVGRENVPMPTDFLGLFALLATANVRFVLVGGLALVLHGLDRLTADVDLVIDFSAESARAAVQALTEAGYRSLAPVDPLALTDPEQRHEWQAAHNMQVFSFWDSSNTRPTVDIMLAPEVPFEELGRAQDLADIERLRSRLED